MQQGAKALQGIHSNMSACLSVSTSQLISRNIDQVDKVMDNIREQMDVANEIGEAISNPGAMGNVVDEVGQGFDRLNGTRDGVADAQDELKAELEALEQEELDDRLAGADRVPLHTPASPIGQTNGPSRQSLSRSACAKLMTSGVAAQADEDDEEAQLRQLQAELAM